MTAEINKALDAISRKLFAGSLNYAASFKLVTCDGIAGAPLQEILAAALGKGFVIGGASAAGPSEVVEALQEALFWRGDDSSFPDPKYRESEEFKHNAASVLAWVGALVEGAGHILSFWLQEGHPFYPVFWDFAFSIEKGADAFVFIGSSSD